MPSTTLYDDEVDTANISCLEAALDYEQRGWVPVPLWPLGDDGLCTCGKAAGECKPGKHPWVKWSLNERPQNRPGEVAAWYAYRPLSGVGLLTGSRSGTAVIDCDSEAAYAALLAAGPIPDTYTVRSGRGDGYHLYFIHRDGLGVGTNVLPDIAKGIDLRGEGGLIAAPPTLHTSGRRYAVVDGSPPADMPEWLFTLLTASSARPPRDGAPPRRESGTWLERAMMRATAGDGRNDTGFWLACQLRDADLEIEEAREVMDDYVEAVTDLDEEPYAYEEAYASLDQAYAREARDPAQSQESSQNETVSAPVTDEVASAHLFAARYGHKLKHVTGWGWVAYDGQRWVRQAEKQAQELAKKHGRRLLADAGEIEERRQRDDAIDFARRTLSARGIGGLLKLAESESCISANVKDFDTKPHLLNVDNGTLDLRTGALQPHRAADMITHLAPVEHDPTASCERFTRYLSETFPGDDEIIVYLQRLVGYSTTGETREQKWVYQYGAAGANGKGTLKRALMHVLGDYTYEMDANALTKPKYGGGERTTPALDNLPGKRLVFASEPGGSTLDAERIKQLTGEDDVPVNPKHLRAYSFRPVLTLWLAANRRLDVEDTSNATWRRTVMMEYPVSFDGRQDFTLDEQLQAEASGILNWIIEGAKAWYAEGLGTPPEAVAEAKREYRAEQDPTSVFFSDVLVRAPGEMVRLADAHRAYLTWQAGNWGTEGVSPTDTRPFARIARKYGYATKPYNDGSRILDARLVRPQ